MRVKLCRLSRSLQDRPAVRCCAAFVLILRRFRCRWYQSPTEYEIDYDEPNYEQVTYEGGKTFVYLAPNPEHIGTIDMFIRRVPPAPMAGYFDYYLFVEAYARRFLWNSAAGNQTLRYDRDFDIRFENQHLDPGWTPWETTLHMVEIGPRDLTDAVIGLEALDYGDP